MSSHCNPLRLPIAAAVAAVLLLACGCPDNADTGDRDDAPTTAEAAGVLDGGRLGLARPSSETTAH
ncbi:MAG: hypothetical protein AAF726_16210 [Planctomycetota bacterium]